MIRGGVGGTGKRELSYAKHETAHVNPATVTARSHDQLPAAANEELRRQDDRPITL
jgi:hypothetical protein